MGWIWMKIMKTTAVFDVLVAAVFITTYVYLLSERLPVLQFIPGSKSYHVIVYVYSSICTIFQMLIAFRFYQTLTIPKDDKEHVDAEDLLPITKIWIIGSYVLLFNWALKAGIYAQHCKCGLSVALAIYLAEMAFRFAAICIGNTFLKKLERAITERRSQIKLQAILTAYKARKFQIENV